MKFLPLIFANLFRKKVRTSLTIASIVVALFLYGLLVTIEKALTGGVDVAGADRLVVINKVSLIMPLPFSYRDRILQVPGVTGVNFATWFGGIYQDEKNFFPSMAIDTETLLTVFPELVVSKDQWEAFLRDREGALVGRKLIERFGWKLGDRIPLKGTIWPGTWEFNIRAIFDGKRPEDDTSSLFFQHDYLEERRPFGKGTVGWYTVKLDTPDHAAEVAKTIDDRFANSAYETSTETEKSFATGIVKQMGNVKLIILSIGSVVFFTLLLVTGNTMAMAVRERMGELAVLKTVGFTDVVVLVLVLAESMISAVVGAAIGLGLAKLFTLSGDPTHGLLPVFYLAPRKMLDGMGLAVAAGIVAGIIPAVTAMRLKIVDALRRV